MPTWLKHSFFNIWRKPFRTGPVVLFLAIVVGLFTVMATVNRLAAGQFATLEGALESTIYFLYLHFQDFPRRVPDPN